MASVASNVMPQIFEALSHVFTLAWPLKFYNLHTRLARSLSCCVAGVACGTVWCGVVPATVASAAHTPLPLPLLPFLQTNFTPFPVASPFFSKSKTFKLIVKRFLPISFLRCPSKSFLPAFSCCCSQVTGRAWMDWMSHHGLPPQRLKQWGTGRDTP